jgi:hypothetical protein
MQIWKKGSIPPPGEYEFSARTGGRLSVWVGEEFVMVNGEPKTLEQVFQAGNLSGPMEEGRQARRL